MKYECEKVFLECDKGSFEINDTRIEEVTFEGTEIDNPFERVKYEGTFTIISGWDSLLRDILWLEMRKVLKIITGKMMMGVLGMIIIRSQDRLDLMRVNRVEISNKQVCAVFEEESNVREIGRYKSEERAIEVLNRIQEAIIAGTKFDIINKDGVRCNKEKVFEMPVE
ncbi:Uncharacterised protein [Clostridioides difficile]|uniref:hypothetical protein n=2 Tax=Clostridioides difficile TaxID=1496 RepID=UPI0009800D66|nr:hypothetical protein [Clostridioides difficile]SJV77646.1 Uncharacterised protein [Clostridioides difficile]